MGNRVRIAAPFVKVETAEDGGRDVYGFATLERKDKQGEIADYSGTVKAFEKWSAEIGKASQGKSAGNLRVMHQPVPVGSVVHWEPGETTEVVDGTEQTLKGVLVRSHVPPWKEETIKDIDAGILTSYSIGGSYAERHWDADANAFRYTPELAELSLVDNPAVPGATFSIVKSADGGGLELNKALLAKAEGLTEEDRKKLHDEAEARAKKYGIGAKEGGNLTPPKGKPTSEADYGDPVNYAYPIDEVHIRPAVGYFNHPDQREKGGYSEEEWAKIGERIAEAANKLVGEGHEFKDGAIAASDDRKEAEKATLAGAMQKAAKGEALSHDDIRSLICAALQAKTGPFGDSLWPSEVWDDYFITHDWDDAKYWRVPYQIKDGAAVLGEPVEVRQTWEPVKGEKAAVAGQVQKAADPEDKAVDAKIKAVEETLTELRAAAGKNPALEARLKAAEEALDELKAAQAKDEAADADDKDDAEKAAQALYLLKTIAGRLAKKAVPISAARRKHLGHAMDHIHAAMGNMDAIEDKDHIAGADAKPEPDTEAEKGATAAGLTKMVGDVIPAALSKALGDLGLAKAADVGRLAEDLAKAAQQLAALEGQVKVIADTPLPGGPYLGAAPVRGGATAWGGMEAAALKVAMDASTDPLVKDAIGRQLAVAETQAMFAGTAQRPTAGPRQ